MPKPDPPEVQDIGAMDPELAAQAIDPKRKARLQDPRRKFGWWPDTTKDFVQCIFYMKVVPSGIKRFKQHLADGFGDTTKCSLPYEIKIGGKLQG
jgi:hypothetical protein